MSTEKQYIQAFNQGYLLEKHKPILLKKFAQDLGPTNNYLQGFFAGKNQFELENKKEQLFEMQKMRFLSHDQEKGFDRET